MDRRTLLKSALGGGILLVSGYSGWSRPIPSPNTEAAFAAATEPEVFKHLFGRSQSETSSQVRLATPLVTAAGLPLPVTVCSSMKNASALAITIERTEKPLAAYVQLSGASCFFRTHLKLEKTAIIKAHVLTADGLFSAARKVKVTRGGYGMHLQ